MVSVLLLAAANNVSVWSFFGAILFIAFATAVFGALRHRIEGDEVQEPKTMGISLQSEEMRGVWKRSLERWNDLSQEERILLRGFISRDVRWEYPDGRTGGNPSVSYAWDILGFRLMRLSVTTDPQTFKWAYVPLESIRRLMPEFYRNLIEGWSAENVDWTWVSGLPNREWVEWVPKLLPE